MRQGYQGKRIGVILQGGLLCGVVEQFGHRKADAHLAIEHVIPKSLRFPVSAIVSQHRHAGHRAAVAVKNAVVVDKHALRKLGLGRALHFQMDVNPVLLPGKAGHAHQLIDKTLAQLRILRDGLQLLLQKRVTLAPVNLTVCRRKIKRHEFREIALDGFFPGRVVVIRFGVCVHACHGS